MPVNVYGVVATDAVDHLPPLSGPRQDPVRVVASDDLAAIVGDVENAMSVGREAVMAHARILEDVVGRTTVLPARFGTVVDDDDVVRRRLLQDRADECREALDRLEGTVQVTVKGYHREEAAIREVLRRYPELNPSAQGSSLGYMDRFRLGEQIAAGLERLRATDGDLLLNRLNGFAVASAAERVVALHQFANLAFLVRRDGIDDFSAAVASLQRELENRATLRYVGPQPAYSFVGEARAWD